MRNRSGGPPPPPFPESSGSAGVPPTAPPFLEPGGASDTPAPDAELFAESRRSPDALAPEAAPFAESRRSPGAPPPPVASISDPWDNAYPPGPAPFPELLGTAEPAPAARSRGARLLKLLARVALWSLIAVGALRGLLPVPEGLIPAAAGPEHGRPAAGSAGTRDGNQDPGSGGPRERTGAASGGSHDPPRGVGTGSTRGDPPVAAAVAVAFLREFLTIGDDPSTRAERLGRFTAAGADLARSVSVPADAAQYADLVVAAGSRSVAGGIEVTVLAHVLQFRSGAYRDGGTLAFVVPLVAGREGIAVAGRPRPTSLPVASGVALPRPGTTPADLPPKAARVARQAVVALVAGDTATLTRLGGGRTPSTRPDFIECG